MASMALVVITFLMGLVYTSSLEKSTKEGQTTYTSKYDNVDIDEVLGSERLLTGYVNCLLDRGPCTPDGKELKRNLPDAIDDDCSKCTAKQREGADRVMDYIIDHRPEDWAKLEEKYKSDGTYKKRYLERKKVAANSNGTKTETENATKIYDTKE